MTIGERIRNARKARNLTQKQLGELAGIAEPTIRRYELGRLKPKFETIVKIADALNESVWELYSNHELDSVTLDQFDESTKKIAYFVREYSNAEETTQRLLEAFRKLNIMGRKIAIERVEELVEIPRYQEELPQD